MQYPLPDVVIAIDVTTSQCAFYFQGSGLPLSISDSWSGSMHTFHIALQELQAVVLILHRMAFLLCSKVFALEFDKITAKVYLCSQVGAISLFLLRLTCCILNLAAKYGIICIPAYFTIHLNVEANYLLQGKFVPEWHLLPHIAQTAFHFGVSQRWILASSCINQCQHYYTVERLLPPRDLGLNVLSHLWKFQVSYLILLPALIPLVMSMFLAEHVTSQFRLLILVSYRSQMSTLFLGNNRQHMTVCTKIISSRVRKVLCIA